MTKYIKNGADFFPMKEEDVPFVNDLPPAVYTMKYNPDPEKGFYFSHRDDFVLPTVLYGKTAQHAARILHTAQSRPATTGVLLAGEKGSGKTLLAKKVAMDAMALGWPTILINDGFAGSSFVSALQMVNRPAVVFIDEYDKLYSDRYNQNDPRPPQTSLLTLLDGAFSTKKIFILTVNDASAVSGYMKNRPGRLFYSIEYNGLDKAFIEEYCNDNLTNKVNIDGIVRASYMFDAFNFDQLQALVEEMNRYDETAKEAIELLNIKALEKSYDNNYSVVSFSREGENIPTDETQKINGVLNKTFFVRLKNEFKIIDEDGDETTTRHFMFEPGDLREMEENGSFLFVNRDGFELVVKKSPNDYTTTVGLMA